MIDLRDLGDPAIARRRLRSALALLLGKVAAMDVGGDDVCHDFLIMDDDPLKLLPICVPADIDPHPHRLHRIKPVAAVTNLPSGLSWLRRLMILTFWPKPFFLMSSSSSFNSACDISGNSSHAGWTLRCIAPGHHAASSISKNRSRGNDGLMRGQFGASSGNVACCRLRADAIAFSGGDGERGGDDRPPSWLRRGTSPPFWKSDATD
jgi:hypothetical protein